MVTDNTVSELTVELLNSPSWISNISSIVNVVGTRGEIRVVATPKNEHVTGEGVAGDKLIIKISDGSSEAIATYSITVVNTDDKVTINIEEVDFIGSEGESYSAIFSIEDIDRNNTVSASDIRIVVEGDWLTGSYDESSKLYTVTGVVETELADGVTESVDVSVEVTDRHAADLGIIHYSYEVEITGVNDLPEIEELEGLYNLIEDTGYEITFNVLDNDSPYSEMVVTVNYDSSELSVEIEDMLGGEYKIKVTGNGDVNGEKSITVKVSDGLSDPINRPVLLQIAAVNDAPTIGEIKKTSHQFGESYIERLEVGDVDTQISSLIVSIDPEVASFSISHLEGTEVFDLVGLDDLEATTHEVTVNVSDGFITSSVFARISIEKVLVVPVFVEPEKELIATEDEEFIYTICL